MKTCSAWGEIISISIVHQQLFISNYSLASIHQHFCVIGEELQHSLGACGEGFEKPAFKSDAQRLISVLKLNPTSPLPNRITTLPGRFTSRVF